MKLGDFWDHCVLLPTAMSVQFRWYEIQSGGGSSESAAVVFYGSNLFPPSVAVAVKEIVSHAPLSLVYRSAQISAVLL